MLAASPAVSLPRRLWRWLKALAITVFVCWHLFFLAVRNPLDLWRSTIEAELAKRPWWAKVKPKYRAVDNATYYYGTFCGVEQGWSMFTPPVARSAPFLAAELTLSDGSTALVLSPNEVEPSEFYFRLGGWRQRKLDDYLVYEKPSTVGDNLELPLWQAYVRWSVRRWRERHPNDERAVTEVRLVRRRYYFPQLNEPPRPAKLEEVETYTIGYFAPDGAVLAEKNEKAVP